MTTYGPKTIAKMQEINNYNDMSREELIYILLRSKKAPQKDNYLKYLNNATNSKLKKRIIDELENKIRKLELENKKHTKTTKERAIAYLTKLKTTLNKKQKYRHVDHHDQNYYVVEDIEHLVDDDIDDYYAPILVRSSFEYFEEYKKRGDKEKILSLKQYMTTTMPYLFELIDKKKNNTQDEQKVQLIIAIIFRHITDSAKKYTFYVKSKKIDMRAEMILMRLLIKSQIHFLRIMKEKKTYCVMEVIMFHTIQLKIGSSYIPSPKWISNKKATINPKNLNDNFVLHIQ